MRVGRRTAFFIALVLLAAGCSAGAPPRAAPSPSLSPVALNHPPVSTSPLPPVDPITPALRATDAAGFTTAQAQQVRAIAGVAAVARVSLGMVTARTPAGLLQVSVAGVDPMEFRPLAPGLTAQADFVWQGLAAGQMFLAHEEQPVLGIPLGDDVSMTGPRGTINPPLGGLAANGTPNIASGLISQQEAQVMGLPGPSDLMIGIAPGADLTAITAAAAKLLPQAQVSPLVSLVNHPLASGTAAERLLGHFNYTANPDGSITEDSAWVRANIVTRSVPILGQVTCNRLMFPQLTGVMTDLKDEGLAGLINVAEYQSHPGNCYQARFVDSDPKRGISNHAWGIAIDINRVQNPEGGANHQDPRLIAAFEHWGFRWGGLFYPPDPMHFELAGIMQ